MDVDGDAAAGRLRALSRARKLLRLAEDQAGRPEGEAARARAEALLAAHGLSWSRLELGAEDYRHRAFALGEAAAWRRTLVHAIADHLDCVALFARDGSDAQTYGPEHALPQVEYLFTVYLRQLREAWRAHVSALQAEGLWAPLGRRGQLDTRESFCVSYVMGVKERMEAERQRERRMDPAVDRVAREGRRRLERWMRTGGVRWRGSANGVASFLDEGFRAGLEATVHAGLRTGARGAALPGPGAAREPKG